MIISIRPELVMSVHWISALGADTLTCARTAPEDGFALIIDSEVVLLVLVTRTSSSIANRSESTKTMPFKALCAALAVVSARRLPEKA